MFIPKREKKGKDKQDEKKLEEQQEEWDSPGEAVRGEAGVQGPPPPARTLAVDPVTFYSP